MYCLKCKKDTKDLNVKAFIAKNNRHMLKTNCNICKSKKSKFILEKDFNINLKEYNKIRHMFKLDYNVTKINFYLYLFNNEIYNDEKMEYLKKIIFNNKKFNLIYELLS